MIREKMQKYGEVSFGVELALSYQRVYIDENGIKVEARMYERASFSTDRHWSQPGHIVGNVATFQRAANAMLRKVRDLLIDGTYVDLVLMADAYESVPEYIQEDIPGHPMKSDIKQIRFDSWHFKESILDEDPEAEGAGLWLKPDARYTSGEAIHLAWDKDILDSLAEANCM